MRFSRLQFLLIDPLRPMKSATALQQARLLSLILVVLIPLGIAAIFMYQFLLPGRPLRLNPVLLAAEITGAALMVVAYAINRAGRYRLAAWMTLALMSITVLIVSRMSLDEYNSFSDSLCVMVPIAIAAVLVRIRYAVLFCGANILLVALLPLAADTASERSDAYAIVGYLVLLSSLLFVIAWHRNRIEAVRQRELRSSAQKYRLLAEKMSDVVFVQGMDLKLQYISPSVKDIFGYTVQEALRLKMQDILTPDSLRRANETLNQYVNLATQGPVDPPLMEFEYIRKDGTTFWGELRAAFLYDPHSTPFFPELALIFRFLFFTLAYHIKYMIYYSYARFFSPSAFSETVATFHRNFQADITASWVLDRALFHLHST